MVFGELHSKMKVGSTEVDLEFSIIRPTYQIPDLIAHRSILTGKRSYRKRANDKARFQVVCNIYKNGDPAAVLADILQYNHETCWFMPHSDSVYDWLKDGGGTEADFYITSMIPYYVNATSPDTRDKLQITFESLGDVNLIEILEGFLVDGDGDFFIDGSGNKLIIKHSGVDRGDSGGGL